MKAKDLIQKLQELDPEIDIQAGCAENDGYGYDSYFHLEVYKDRYGNSCALICVEPLSTNTDTVWH